MNTPQELITICLVDLPEKDQAVIQRVVTFGASQGKPYILTKEHSNAHITITLDSSPMTISNGLHIRVGDASLPCDFRIQRPLLVTRVMRTLDDAAQLLKSRPQPPLVCETSPTKSKFGHPETTNTTPRSLHTPPESASTVVPQSTHGEATKTSTPNIIEVSQTSSPATSNNLNPVTDNHQDYDDNCHYTALVVDDSAAIRKQLELELRDAQIRADFAETGEEALEKTKQKQYDIVFLDIILPGIDGYEVCRQLRVRKTMKKTPIIMLSGKTSPLDEVKGVIAGASTYLTKPVKHEQFQQTLQRVSKWLTNFAY